MASNILDSALQNIWLKCKVIEVIDMIKITHRGDLRKTKTFLKKAERANFFDVLDYYGRRGVEALRSATPVDTGKTASSWTYEIKKTNKETVIFWNNTNVIHDVNIAVIIQYGHGTRNGGYVQGRDYINPVIQPIFDEIAAGIWREVIS